MVGRRRTPGLATTAVSRYLLCDRRGWLLGSYLTPSNCPSCSLRPRLLCSKRDGQIVPRACAGLAVRCTHIGMSVVGVTEMQGWPDDIRY